MTSRLSVSRFGVRGPAPSVSAARRAKPSTLERSKGGVSIGAMTWAAITRDSAAVSGADSPASGARSTCASKRRRASAAETTSRNCSCRAARRIASTIALLVVLGLASGLIAAAKANSRPWVNGDIAAGGKAFAGGRNENPAVAAGERGQGQISGPERLRHPTAAANRDHLGHAYGRRHFAAKRRDNRHVVNAAVGEFGRERPPDQEPDHERGIEPARNKQDRPVADKAKRRGLARTHRNAMRLDPATSPQFLHPAIPTSAPRPPHSHHT